MSDPQWARHLPAGAAATDLDLGSSSLTASWVGSWAADSAASILWDADSGWTTAAELEDRSRRVAGRMAACGVGPGDRVLLSAGASRDLVVAHVAVLRLGAVALPVNPAYTARELAHVTADAEPALAVVDDESRAARLRDGPSPPPTICGPDVALADAAPPVLDTARPEDPALLCYTSGTTGAPKGAELTHANALASAMALRIAWRWTTEDRLVLALPLFHMHGLGVGLHGTLTAGASCVLLPRFGVDAVLDAAAAQRATMFFGVPTMYARVAGSDRRRELDRLRLCVSGSAPLAPELFQALAVGGRPVLERYGMTETLMLLSNPYDGERRPGSVGFPLPGVEARLSDDGEILVRGPNVFAGYRRRPDATADAFDEQGWFRTGDTATLDPDGYWRIVGRKSDMIITGGYNVYPREVEDVLRAHPNVADAAVVGVADPDLGEVVVVAVVPVDEPHMCDAEALLAFAAERLAPYKRPRRVVFRTDLPRNAMGKVLRRQLAGEVEP